MGAKPTQAPDTTDIGGVKAEGVAITASLGGEPEAGQRSTGRWLVIGLCC